MTVAKKLLREFAVFVWEGRNFWLIPIGGALILVGGLVLFSEFSPLAPYIYPLY